MMEGKFNTIVQLSNLTTVRADSCHQLSCKILGGDAEFGAIVGGDAENGAKKLLSVTRMKIALKVKYVRLIARVALKKKIKGSNANNQ